MRTPVVVSIHGLDWSRDKWPAPARAALKLAERTIVRHADRITVVSQQLQHYFEGTYERAVEYIPNGVELRAGPADHAILSDMGLLAGEYVLFASRLVQEKGAHELIAAFNRVQTTKKLVIAGGDRYDQAYVASLKAIDTTGRCVFTGHLEKERLEHVFKGASLYILPSHLEGLSLSLLEALGYGKAILVSDIPENIEAVGEAARTFRVGVVDDLSRTIQDLLEAPEELATLETAARLRASQLYNWDAIAQRYDEVFRAARR
jgi:glycosyltransferase involved in cell wall biosynthesis